MILHAVFFDVEELCCRQNSKAEARWVQSQTRLSAFLHHQTRFPASRTHHINNHHPRVLDANGSRPRGLEPQPCKASIWGGTFRLPRRTHLWHRAKWAASTRKRVILSGHDSTKQRKASLLFASKLHSMFGARPASPNF